MERVPPLQEAVEVGKQRDAIGHPSSVSAFGKPARQAQLGEPVLGSPRTPPARQPRGGGGGGGTELFIHQAGRQRNPFETSQQQQQEQRARHAASRPYTTPTAPSTAPSSSNRVSSGLGVPPGSPAAHTQEFYIHIYSNCATKEPVARQGHGKQFKDFGGGNSGGTLSLCFRIREGALELFDGGSGGGGSSSEAGGEAGRQRSLLRACGSHGELTACIASAVSERGLGPHSRHAMSYSMSIYSNK